MIQFTNSIARVKFEENIGRNYALVLLTSLQ